MALRWIIPNTYICLPFSPVGLVSQTQSENWIEKVSVRLSIVADFANSEMHLDAAGWNGRSWVSLVNLTRKKAVSRAPNLQHTESPSLARSPSSPDLR